jgi:hypothetical protein
MQVSLKGKGPICGIFAEPSDGIDASTAAGLNPSLGARKLVRKAILEPDNNEIYAAYTLIRENLHINDPGRTR